MKLFKSMSQKEAQEFYNKIKSSKLDLQVKQIFLGDILFFSKNLTQDY